MDLLENFSEEITKWDVLRDIVDIDVNEDSNNDLTKSALRVQLLPRKSLNLYGTIPKMEQRIYLKCKECRFIFNPRDIVSHKVCSGRSHTSLSPFDLKKKSKSKSSRKSHSNTPSPPPFKKPPSPTSPAISSVATDVTKLSPKVLKGSSTASIPASSSTSTHRSSTKVSSATHLSKTILSHIVKSSKSEHSSHTSKSSKSFSSTDQSSNGSATSKSSSNSSHGSGSSSSNSSRHKKSKKSSSSGSKTNEEYDPSIHCGVVEDNKGPCTRSLSCSNHRIQLRKFVTNRSKEVHHLISEKKASKDSKHNSSNSHSSPNGLESIDTGESYDPTSEKPKTLNIVLPTTKDCNSSQNPPTSTKQIFDVTDLEIKFSKTAEVLLSQENDAGTVPVVYMPMSPVSVVSPVEYVKIGKNIIRLESPQSAMSPPLTTNQSVILGIPSTINVKMYNSHPKPITLPSYGSKKIGGAILLSKHQLELQRNNLLMAISSNVNFGNSIEGFRTSSNSSNMLYKPNILKNKNNSKSNNYKRSISEKCNTSDSKQMKFSSNLNGFLLHSTISETAEAPISNILMNDKMGYFTMN